MPEDTAHFRIKKGDVEIEYHGSSEEVSSRFDNVLEWVKTTPVTTAPKEPEKPPVPVKEEKVEKRGGARTGVISPAVDELITEGFFNEFKNASQVLEELRRKTVPVSDIDPVILALNRRVPKKLDRIKGKDERWVYRKKA